MIRKIFIIVILTALGIPLCLGSTYKNTKNQIEHTFVTFDLSPDGKQIVFSSAAGDLFLLNLITYQVTQLTNTKDIEIFPAFSPDGKYITYSSIAYKYTGASIYTYSLDSNKVVRLTNDNNAIDVSPSYSSDGKQIVFARTLRSNGSYVFIMNSDGTNIRQITTQNHRGISSPNFTFDGKKIIYAAADSSKGQLFSTIFEVEVNNSLPKALIIDDSKSPKYAALGSEPKISRDGKQIVFISDKENPYAYDLHIMSVAGENPTPLSVTHISSYNKQPKPSVDGATIYYLAGTSYNDGNRPIFSLWRVGIDGKSPIQIADSSLFDNPLVWKPRK